MKNLTLAAVAVASFLIFSSFTEKPEKPINPEKTIIGSWVNPPVFVRSGKMLGFQFQKGGKCKAINIPSQELQKWTIEGKNLIMEGVDLNEDGTTTPYRSVRPIVKLNKDTLQILDKVKGYARFTYLNTKHLKKLVKSGKIVKGE